MAHAQKPDFIFRRNGQVHLNWRGRQFSRLLAAEVCASAVVMLDTPCSKVVWRVLATHSIRQFPLHSRPPNVSPCAITFQLDSTEVVIESGFNAHKLQKFSSNSDLINWVMLNFCNVTSMTKHVLTAVILEKHNWGVPSLNLGLVTVLDKVFVESLTLQVNASILFVPSHRPQPLANTCLPSSHLTCCYIAFALVSVLLNNLGIHNNEKILLQWLLVYWTSNSLSRTALCWLK
jgi:hypothetical protein